jgi:membrane associated rhomboid family serine protease
MPDKHPQLSVEDAFFRKKILLSIIIPAICIILMWLVKLTELLFKADFSEYGIYPLSLKGLPGILLSPFIHADFNHLFNNTIPLFFLSSLLF